MESKFELQFEDNEYYLVDGNTNDTVATTDKVLLKEYDGYMKKLSLKNCQAIANGYDLDDKISKHLEKNDIEASTKRVQVIKELILEILGDKKFSEDDVRKAIEFGMKSYHSWYDRNEDEFIQSLQQTEWDVEIEMECVMGCQNLILNGENSVCCGDKKPKLDSNGCLILKKV